MTAPSGDYIIEAWPIRNGWVPTNWSAEGKEIGGADYGAPFTYCFRVQAPSHLSTFAVGFTEQQARAAADEWVQEHRNR